MCVPALETSEDLLPHVAADMDHSENLPFLPEIEEPCAMRSEHPHYGIVATPTPIPRLSLYVLEKSEELDALLNTPLRGTSSRVTDGT